MPNSDQQTGDVEHYYPTDCVLCPHTAETPEGHEQHMEAVHDG